MEIAQNMEQQCLAYRRCLIDEGQESKWELRYTEGTHSWGVPWDSGCLAFQYHLMIKCWTLEEWRLGEEPGVAVGAGRLLFPPYPPRLPGHGTSFQRGHGGRRCVAVPPSRLPKRDSQAGSWNHPPEGRPHAQLPWRKSERMWCSWNPEAGAHTLEWP